MTNDASAPTHLIIVNPNASRGAAAEAIPAVRQRLDAAGLRYRLVETQGPRHAVELARQGATEGMPVVVAMGGDGILNEVLNGLMLARKEGHTRTALGLIPVGRGNDFAYGARVPENALEACDVLIAGRKRPMDVGFAAGGDVPQGQYFGNGVGIGFDAVVGFEALKMTWLSGFACYAVAAFKTIMVYFKAPLLRLEFEGCTMDIRCLMLSVMNGRRMGGGFHMAPQGQNDDGIFDLLIGQSQTRRKVFGLIPRFMKGTQFGRPGIFAARTSRMTVTALEGGIPAHADGETLCTAGQRLDIEIIPQAIEMVCRIEQP